MNYQSDMVTAIHEARIADACRQRASRRLRRRFPRLAVPLDPAREV